MSKMEREPWLPCHQTYNLDLAGTMRGIMEEKGFAELVDVVEECASVGITCEECRVRDNCISIWDNIVSNGHLNQRCLKALKANFTELRIRKREEG